MTYILSIDPGGKGGETGIALGRYNNTEPYHLVHTWAVKDDVDGFKEWYEDEWIIRYFSIAPSIEVICEHFVNRNVPGADLTPCFVEGSVRTLFDHVVLQPASGKNTAVSDEVLKRLGVYTPGGHHRDITEATRHAVWYVKKSGHKPTLLKGWSKQ